MLREAVSAAWIATDCSRSATKTFKATWGTKWSTWSHHPSVYSISTLSLERRTRWPHPGCCGSENPIDVYRTFNAQFSEFWVPRQPRHQGLVPDDGTTWDNPKFHAVDIIIYIRKRNDVTWCNIEEIGLKNGTKPLSGVGDGGSLWELVGVGGSYESIAWQLV